MTLNTYLWITGIGAFIALVFPVMIVIGTFLFVVPGLILMMMPTAFLYGLVFGALRHILAFVLTGVPLNIAAAVATVAVMWAIPQPVARGAKARLDSLREPNLLPSAPIALSGHVRISGTSDRRCDQLCAALLKTPGVTSVGIGTGPDDVLTYRLVDVDAPGESETPIGFGMSPSAKYNSQDPSVVRRGLEAEWNLMLSARRLKLVANRESIAADFAIVTTDGPAVTAAPRKRRSNAWSLAASIPRKLALEIFDREGQPLLRQSILSVDVPSAPLSIGTVGSIDNFHFRWDRRRIGDAKEHVQIPRDALILEHTTIARGVDVAAVALDTRSELVAALADPARPADDPAFKLANQWMEGLRSLKEPLGDSERRILARIFEDRRVTSSEGLVSAVRRVRDLALDLRRLAAQRFLAPGGAKPDISWVNALRYLPAGAYAVQLPEEREILSSPATSMYAHGLIVRLADRGLDAIPDLLRLLQDFSTHDPGQYSYSDLSFAASCVGKAFRAIGPAAACARGEFEALLATPGLARHYERDRQDWDVLLVVLGRPVETIDKPRDLSGTDEDYRQRLAELAARPFRPDWA